eukprot:7111682-Prymnesium_polylepis.1
MLLPQYTVRDADGAIELEIRVCSDVVELGLRPAGVSERGKPHVRASRVATAVRTMRRGERTSKLAAIHPQYTGT